MSDIMDNYRERRRNNAKGEVLKMLFDQTHKHCVYNFQFDDIVELIDQIYHPEVVLDKGRIGGGK